MTSKCFVPNCKNTVGIDFPKEPELKKKWLQALKIKHVIPNPSSYVCVDHFKESDLCHGDPGKVKDDAIPCIVTSRKNSCTQVDPLGLSTQNETGEQETESKLQVGTSPGGISENLGNSENSTESCANEEGNDTMKEEQETSDINIETQTKEPSEISNNEVPEVVMFNLDTKICRLCTKDKPDTKNIFVEKIENVPVSVAIMECIYPIEILRNDTLSKEICSSCLDGINTYFKFRSTCLENDKKQRDMYNEDESQIEVVEGKELIKELKRKAEEVANTSAKKQRVRTLLPSDSDEESDDQEQDDLQSLSDFLVKKECLDVEEKKSPRSLATLHRHDVSKQMQSDIDKKFDKVEEELRRVLEGQLTEEQAIIIHVENDDEEQSPEKLTLSKLKLPITIKSFDTKKQIKEEVPIASSRRRIIEGDIKIPLKIKTINNDVVLPKGINVTRKDSYRSSIGMFEGIPISYVFGTEFCHIDGYLFEYRLCKGNVRYLRCVLPSCYSQAVQNRIKPGVYSNVLTVEKYHNHKRPEEAERKKQMFYYVMKRKMQSDKTLNFRSVYEEVCRCDPVIKELVPLRNVINEICRHQLTYKMQPINSFEHFYSHIEEDAFQKLHFTHNGRQFYQEKFTAEDDSKAVVFANADIIEQVSYSNLMYVDASFKIDTNEDFKYQLVTVLVWVDDSYYPILFALVNRKSQDVYKNIFEYLHDTLAPKLRPEEIVTDYEANIYYALGETYIDSSIGGSVFYYTQNLYKKICTLNLSRDLETNSYFRNIYHMLLMLPLLPVNTILDGLNNMEIQARDLGLNELTRAIFDHVRTDWIMKVTPDLFCVHRLENRINENVIAPFKKLRDFIMLSKGKMQKQHTSIITVVEKLIELEHFLQLTYSAPNKKSFARDLSSSQKKNVLKAWQFIERYPKININNFFSKVLGYIKCMENQLWIWGFYRYDGGVTDDLINATNFSIVSNDVEVVAQSEDVDQPDEEYAEAEESTNEEGDNDQVVVEAVIDENGGFVLQNNENTEQQTPFENAFLKYVYKE